MLRPGATAAADHLHPQIFDEVHQRHPQLHRGEAVDRIAAHVLGQPGVGDAGDHKGRLLRQVLDVIFHQIWPRGAVEAQNVDRVGFKNRQGRRHFGADQHGALLLHSDGDHERQAGAGGGEGLLNPIQGGFDLQHVLAGFHQHQVNAAVDQPLRLLHVGIFQGVEVDVAEGGEFCPRPHGASDEAGLVGGRIFVGDAAGQGGGGFIEFVGAIGQIILRQHDRSAAKGVGLDHVGPGLKEASVDDLNRLGVGEHQVFVAAFVLGAAKVVGGQVLHLEVGAHGTVENHHRAIGAVEAIEKGARHGALERNCDRASLLSTIAP